MASDWQAIGGHVALYGVAAVVLLALADTPLWPLALGVASTALLFILLATKGTPLTALAAALQAGSAKHTEVKTGP
jgi:hypothetical protein